MVSGWMDKRKGHTGQFSKEQYSFQEGSQNNAERMGKGLSTGMRNISA